MISFFSDNLLSHGNMILLLQRTVPEIHGHAIPKTQSSLTCQSATRSAHMVVGTEATLCWVRNALPSGSGPSLPGEKDGLQNTCW